MFDEQQYILRNCAAYSLPCDFTLNLESLRVRHAAKRDDPQPPRVGGTLDRNCLRLVKVSHTGPMPDARCPIPDARCPMPDARFPIPDAGVPYTDHLSPLPGGPGQMPDPRCPMPDARLPLTANL